jgi:hypothetical protein
MGFPTTPTDLVTQLLIDGVWTSVTGRGEPQYNITRGRGDERSRAASGLPIVLSDSDLTNRNPASPYYGKLPRNTRVRIISGPVESHIRTWGPRSSSFAFTADHASLDITGDIDLRVECAPEYNAAPRVLMSKWESFSDERSWALLLNPDGTVMLAWTTAGTTATILTATSTAPVPAAYRQSIRATLDANNGAAGHTVTFYTATRLGGAYTQLGDPVVTAGTTSIYSSAAFVYIGFSNGGTDDHGWADGAGKFYAAQIRSSIGGTVVANPAFTAWALTDTTVADSAGRSWTVGPVGGTGMAEVSSDNIRFSGEIPSWKPRWTRGGRDVAIHVEAAGILRRLAGGTSRALVSAMRRAVRADSMADYVVAYWPLEDGSDTTRPGSGIDGGAAMTMTPGVTMSSNSTSFPGSRALPVTTAGELRGGVNAYDFDGEIAVHMLLHVPAAGLTDTAVLADWYCDAGGVRRMAIRYRSGGQLSLHIYDATDTELATSGALAFDVRNRAVLLSVTLAQDGTGVDWGVQTTRAASDGTLTETLFSGTFTSQTLTRVHLVIAGHGGLLVDTVVGHLVVANSVAALNDLPSAMSGWAGETAGARIERLCEEEGVDLINVGDLSDTAPMGPQGEGKLIDLLVAAELADGGILHEPRAAFGVAYRTRISLYNQPGLRLDYEQHISEPFDPNDDDQPLRNLIIASRPDGGSYTAEQLTGPLSTAQPPAGAGVYEYPQTVNVATDEQLPGVAGWWLHEGTWDEYRWPSIGIERARAVFTSDSELTADLHALDVGDLVTVANPPAWLPPDTISAVVQGVRETLGNKSSGGLWWNASPGGIWTVGQLDLAARSRLDTAGSVLAEAITSADTSFDVATTSGPLWVTDTAQFDEPMLIRRGGEVMSVTAIAESLITFGGVGTVAHGVNASVSPAIPAGAGVGNLMVLLAAIRNSGAGVPTTPTDWTRLDVFPSTSNVQLFAKIHDGSEAAPSVAFTGGVANADTTAQIIYLPGKWYSAANCFHGFAATINGSAQDITYPPLRVEQRNSLILYVGWKQDDWTSVASPGTEISEPDTTTGDDQGIVWAYQIQTDAANISAGTFAVTGGASAISRAAVVALRCDAQTVTADRGYNGFAAAASAGDSFQLAYPLRLAR